MKIKNILKSCLDPKVIISIVVIIVLAYIFAPQIAQYTWILFILICPISMMLMMVAMKHDGQKYDKLFICPECDLSYREAEWAKRCAVWCKEHKSCNLEITKHSIQNNGN